MFPPKRSRRVRVFGNYDPNLTSSDSDSDYDPPKEDSCNSDISCSEKSSVLNDVKQEVDDQLSDCLEDDFEFDQQVNFPIDSNITHTRTRRPQENEGPQTRLSRALSSAFSGGVLNVWEAGKALLSAHRASSSYIREDTDRFVAKVSKTFRETCLDDMDIDHPDAAMILAFGNLLVGQINLAMTLSLDNAQKNLIEKLKPDCGLLQVSGAEFYVKGTFFYPKELPFSGERITCEGFVRGNVAAHIALRKNLFIVLGRSCKNPSDIQEGSWLLPGAKYCKGTVRQFPTQFYKTLQELFLEYYNINHLELDVKYRNEFANLPFLRVYEDHPSKKKMFEELAQAREVFLATSFHKELNAALVELRAATYNRPEAGCRYGSFEYRKRGSVTKKKETTKK